MAVPAIFHDLIGAGVEFETDGERIRWRNAGGRVTTEVVEVLRSHKAEVISFLSAVPIISDGHDKLPGSWPGRGYPPEAIRQGVTAAFTDYAATNDPFDARAWV